MGEFYMRLILTALIFIEGLFFLVLGAGFLLMPHSTVASFHLMPDGAGGAAVLRADFPALFFVGGGAMLWGAWKRNGDLLLVPAALFGIALFGRIVSLFADGTYPQFWSPMLVEAAAVILCVIASRVLPHRLT
jgi:peptidoglycan/LPS O-acetylase OafA/YrhL